MGRTPIEACNPPNFEISRFVHLGSTATLAPLTDWKSPRSPVAYCAFIMESSVFEAQSLFYQSAYSGCIEFAQTHAPNGITDNTSLILLVYAARAALAMGDIAGARQLLGDDSEQPVAMSVLLLADFTEMKRSGDDAGSEDVIQQLIMLLDVVEPGELAAEIVRYQVGLALHENGDTQNALETLGVIGAGGSTELECIALGVHILLEIQRVDLAEKEYLAARKQNDDSILVQYMEAWIGLVRGGRATQQAYYVYDEMSQNTMIAHTRNMVPSLVGKAVAQAAQNDVPGATNTLNEALALDPQHTLALANQGVVQSLASDVTVPEAESTTNIYAKTDPASALVSFWDTKRYELEQAVAAMQ